MKLLKILSVALLSLVIIGCSKVRPIEEPTYTVTGYSAAKVEKAILNAQNADRGWVLKKQKSGLITGKLINRQFVANVQIPYSKSGYTIKYVSSENLLADGKNIHGNYNRWVNNLDIDIRKELNKL